MNNGAKTALILAPVLLFGGCSGGVVLLASLIHSQTQNECTTGTGVVVDASGITGEVAGYSGEQLDNAAAIINAGAAMGLSQRDQTIGVMTAMGESGLRVLDYGDVAGPDSRGLFQQRDNGAWGSLADRMDPTRSATSFFRVLADVNGRDQMAPTRVANRVQRNADPDHYTRWWDPAVAVVAALATANNATATAPPPPPATVDPADPPVPPGIAPDIVPAAAAIGTAACGGARDDVAAGAITADGWTAPAGGPFTSAYGMRTNPVTGIYKLHSGIDLAPGCESPIYAAAAGTVVRSGAAASYGNLIVIDHGNGATTYYAHMHSDDLLVGVGQQVAAGAQIARVGTAGNSTGCHLHFEVRIGGEPINPLPFLDERGVSVGPLL
ncbi:M23 family metallopeptidase [Pseudokineococcus sp. 1T1Z-3]|uniref:M23 family metallopeptidase n=1 Tax=Pseudokineococcus sp. 1T1Z-3 TaxID=3132745 RepID=UPI003097E396